MASSSACVQVPTRMRSSLGRIFAALFATALAVALGLSLVVPRAFADDAADPFAATAQTDLADGEYAIDVALVGGTGKATIASPALLTVKDGHAALTVVWSSDNYDYMKVGDAKFLPTTLEPGSTFQIPLVSFDEPFTVVGDTTAMSKPHEVEYQIEVKKDSIASGAPAASQAAPSASSAQAPSSESAASAQASSASASASSASSSAASASSGSAVASASGNDVPIVPIVVIAIIVVAVIVGMLVKRRGDNR